MKKENLEDKTWKISKANKKHNGKRFKRQFLVFLFSIAIIAIVVLIGICIYSKRECELWKIPEIVEDLNIEEDFLEEDIEEDYEEEIDEQDEEESYKFEEFEDVYSIEDKDFYLYDDSFIIEDEHRGFKLLEYDNSNKDYALIYYIFYDYTTDPSYYYALQITDSGLNSVLLDEKNQQEKEERIIGGTISTAKIKKVDLNSKIIITVSEKIENNTSYKKEAKIEIDLSKDLVQKEKIEQNNIEQEKLMDASFLYIYDEYFYKGDILHAYSTNLIGENVSIRLKAQFGNKLIDYSHIDFSAEKNVNNLNLNQAFEDYKLITENMGQYGLSDVYGLDIANGNEIVLVNFDEMKNLAKGQTITKNGKNYSKKDFSIFDGISIEKVSDEIIGNNIKTVKYVTPGEEDSVFYMFIYKGNIYTVKVPTDNRVKEEVQNFLDSIELD